MKKTVYRSLIFILLVINGGISNAQFEEGDILFNAGISLGTYGWYHYNWPGYSYVYSPAFQASLERGFHQYVGIGVIGGYHARYYRYNPDKKYFHRHNYLSFGGYASFHYTPLAEEVLEMVLSDVDLYASFVIRLEIDTYTYSYYDSYGILQNSSNVGSRIWAGPVLGGRYYFTDHLALFGEISYGGNIGFLTVGGTIKF